MEAPISSVVPRSVSFQEPLPASFTETKGSPAFKSPARSNIYHRSPSRLSPSPLRHSRYKLSRGQSLTDVSDIDGSSHFVGSDELEFYAGFINQKLENTAVPNGKIPVNEDFLTTSCADGIIFCYLLNQIEPGIIDEKSIHCKDNLSRYHKGNNCNIAINSLKSLGANVVNIGASDLVNEKQVLVLAFLWCIVRTTIGMQISLKKCPQLKHLKKTGETDTKFSELPVEEVLLRWFNHQLKGSGCDRKITNFDRDLADGHCYMELLHKLGHGRKGADMLAQRKYAKPDEIANLVIDAARSDLDVKPLIQAQHIREGNSRLNVAFIAQLFNAVPDITEESKMHASVSNFRSLFGHKSCHALDPVREEKRENSAVSSTHIEHQSSDNEIEQNINTSMFDNEGGLPQPPRRFYEALIPHKKKKGGKIVENIDDENVGKLVKAKGMRGFRGPERMYQSVKDTFGGYHEKYYAPVTNKVSEWAKRNPTVMSLAETAVKPVTVVSALSVAQLLFQVSSEMSIAGAL